MIVYHFVLMDALKALNAAPALDRPESAYRAHYMGHYMGHYGG